ncbi:MAG: hypothetical protein ABMA15_21680 [Vicinamibacterales bacterium]
MTPIGVHEAAQPPATHDPGADTRRADVARWLAGAAALWAMAVGALVLVGWALDIEAFRAVEPGSVAMKANTALCFVLAGAALWALRTPQPTSSARRVAVASAAVVALIGLLTLLEHRFSWELGLDQLLFQDPLPSGLPIAPGRMSVSAALNWFMFGVALLLLDRPGTRALSQVMALATLGFGFLALLGYLYGLYDPQQFDQVRVLSVMAMHTAVTFMVLALT